MRVMPLSSRMLLAPATWVPLVVMLAVQCGLAAAWVFHAGFPAAVHLSGAAETFLPFCVFFAALSATITAYVLIAGLFIAAVVVNDWWERHRGNGGLDLPPWWRRRRSRTGYRRLKLTRSVAHMTVALTMSWAVGVHIASTFERFATAGWWWLDSGWWRLNAWPVEQTFGAFVVTSNFAVAALAVWAVRLRWRWRWRRRRLRQRPGRPSAAGGGA